MLAQRRGVLADPSSHHQVRGDRAERRISRYPVFVGTSRPPRLFERSNNAPISGTISVAREVWVASWDVGCLQRLSLRLRGHARVVVLKDADKLARAGHSTLVLLDACAPGIDIVGAAPRLAGSSATVVVWGGSGELRGQLAEEPGTDCWVFIPQDTHAHQLAELLSSMI